MKNLITTALLGLFLLTACTTLTVQTDYDTSYNFSKLKTYAWLEDKPPSDDIRINNSLIIKRVVNAVNNTLQSRGYKLVSKDKADFFVNWFGYIDNKIQQETINTYYRHPGYATTTWEYSAFSRTYTYEYQEGTLIIDILDATSRQLIWRGTGQDYLEENETPENITERINRTVAGILNAFPPGSQPARQ
ncbi:uncharacterized protein DUF4136 [Thiogranum longum]|uniref:Uncharacterized protein DUF4136 n=1 Tax=Thiogranum longum TaxID=1537524 RepID=A0A4V2PGZ3_9GAMM|nr:DUF4136 domain-containing protein [Thiogranum longum]TCK18736.1 uncharacterized protein DUF4136 [Thiogranum longum]